MKKVLVIILLFRVFISSAHTPHYTSGIGLRAGKFNTGVTYKNFIFSDNRTALEVDAYYTHIAAGGYTLKGFVLRQMPFKIPIVQIPLDFIVGLGLHASYFPNEEHLYYKREDKVANYYEDDTIIAVGIDGNIGIEYKIQRKDIPISIGIEFIPFYEIINPGPEFVDVGVSVRYVFR